MSSHNEPRVLQLLGDIARARARNLNPCSREDGTGSKHVGDIHNRVNGVQEGVTEIEGGRHVVHDTRDGRKLGGAFFSFPDTEHADEKVIRKTRVQHLADKEDIGRESGLQHDGHVGSVEEAHRVAAAGTTLARALDGDLDTESLEVDDGGENSQGSQQIHDVGQVLAIEGFLQGTCLVGPGHQQVEQGNDSALELWATASVAV